MKIQDVILRAVKIRWVRRRRLAGLVTPRCGAGNSGLRLRRLHDPRRGQPSPRRVPVKNVLELYQEEYFDLNVQYFNGSMNVENYFCNWTLCSPAATVNLAWPFCTAIRPASLPSISRRKIPEENSSVVT
jgi:hypothetical protein